MRIEYYTDCVLFGESIKGDENLIMIASLKIDSCFLLNIYTDPFCILCDR